MRAREYAEGIAETTQVVVELGRQPGADLRQGGADRVVEDGALQRAQQVFAEGEREDLVGREGDVAQLEAV